MTGEAFIYYPPGYSKPPRIVIEKCDENGKSRTHYAGTLNQPPSDLVMVAASNYPGYSIISSRLLQPRTDELWNATAAEVAKLEAAKAEYKAAIDKLRRGELPE